MADFGESSNKKTIINLSRNNPVALIVGVAGFIGSHLCDELLKKDIQIVGIDDFSSGSKKNLEEAVKSNKFHLVNLSITSGFNLDLSRLDYAFFTAEDPINNKSLYSNGLRNFISLVNGFNPKIVLISSIDLYSSPTPRAKIALKNAEIELAKTAKAKKLNARIVRLASIFGPRMHFREDEPTTRLIQASLSGDLQKEQTSMDFSTRSLFIADAVSLITKAAFSGSTSHQIYDGCLPNPIKVSEVKQILLDPLWYEEKGFQETELPPWNTPNLKKTLSELNWRPGMGMVEALKRTVAYFKDSGVAVPKVRVGELEGDIREWRSELPKVEPVTETIKPESQSRRTLGEELGIKTTSNKNESLPQKNLNWSREKVGAIFALGLILIALIYPVFSLTFGVWSIRSDLKSSGDYLKVGDFDRANSEANAAKASVSDLKDTLAFLGVLNRVNLFKDQVNQVNQITQAADQAIDGVSHAITGAKDLYQVSSFISGETNNDPDSLYIDAKSQLGSAQQSLGLTDATLSDQSLGDRLPGFIQDRVIDLRDKVRAYSVITSQSLTVANLLPSLTAIDSKKSYLLLLANNLNLRGSGGEVKSYALVDFEKGRLKDIKVDDVSTLDANIQGNVTPPTLLKNDLGISSFLLKDSLFEPDFPTAAKAVEVIYSSEGGGGVDGVIVLDLDSLSTLLKAIGGVSLSDYSENITSENLKDRFLAHPQPLPGKKSIISEVFEGALNKAFFLKGQNTPGVLSSLGDGLSSKHITIYLNNQDDYSYVLSENWGGLLGRGGGVRVGESDDFLSIVDSNMSSSSVNLYTKGDVSLETSLSSDGVVLHHLRINYQNSSKDTPYKDRVRIYLPTGVNLNKASFGETDITKDFSSFSDYSRSVYSDLITINQGETKALVLDYTLPGNLNFNSNSVDYLLTVVKQSGQESYPFIWSLTYPNNFKVTPGDGGKLVLDKQEVDFKADLSMNQTFRANFKK